MLMDLGYPDNHRKRQLVSFNYAHQYIPQRFLTVEQIGNLLLTQTSLETFSKNLLFLLVKTLSKYVQVIIV